MDNQCKNIEFHAIFQEGVWEIVSDIKLSPLASGVQFAQTVIEGLKIERNSKNEKIIFRLDKYYERLNVSLENEAMPPISFDFFKKSILSVIIKDSQWEESNTLYIRPIIYGLDGSIFPIKSKKYGFSVYAIPLKRQETKKISLYMSSSITRSSSFGGGNLKTASNYIPVIRRKNKDSRDFVLWVNPDTGIVEELDTANIFFVIKNQVVTPKSNHRILNGITRQSLIELLKKENIKVTEKDITSSELMDYLNQKKLTEIILTSTGLGIHNVNRFFFGAENSEYALDSHLGEKVRAMYNKIANNEIALYANWKTIL